MMPSTANGAERPETPPAAQRRPANTPMPTRRGDEPGTAHGLSAASSLPHGSGPKNPDEASKGSDAQLAVQANRARTNYLERVNAYALMQVKQMRAQINYLQQTKVETDKALAVLERKINDKHQQLKQHEDMFQKEVDAKDEQIKVLTRDLKHRLEALDEDRQRFHAAIRLNNEQLMKKDEQLNRILFGLNQFARVVRDSASDGGPK